MIKAFIFALLVIETISTDCPPAEVLAPCQCDAGRYLTTSFVCQGMDITESNITDIKNMMKLKSIQPYFDSISFIKTSITRLERDVFSSFSAKELSFFDNPKLEYIYIEEDSKKIVEVFRIQKCVSFNNSDIIITANQYFPNMRIMEITQTGITEVPNDALNQGTQTNLTIINLSSNQIARLGKDAFNLTNVKEINLSNNKLTQISSRNFILNNNNKDLIIDLQNNTLNETSFQNNCFNYYHPLTLLLQNNKIKHLEETVFRPITEGSDGNRIELFGNPFDCDCSAKWTRQINANMRKKIKSMKCSATRSIQEYTDFDFQYCSPNTTTNTAITITTTTATNTTSSTTNTTTSSTPNTNTTTSTTITPKLSSTTSTKTTSKSTLRTSTASPTSRTTTSTTATISTTTTSSDPWITLKTNISNKISFELDLLEKIAAQVKKIEDEGKDIRQQLSDNISHLKLFETKIDDYHNRYIDNFEMNLIIEQANDEVQSLIKTFISINDKLNQILDNEPL